MPTATTPRPPAAGSPAGAGARSLVVPVPVEQGWLGASAMFNPAAHRRMGRAFSTSAALHVVFAALVLIVMWLRPPTPPPEVRLPEQYDLVFVQAVGPGGGGGGGGNSSPEPPAKLEMKAEPKPVVVEPLTPELPPPPSLVAPVQMTAAVPESGVMRGLAAAPSLGTGTGGGGGTGRGTGTGSGTGAGIGPGSGGGFGGGAMQPGSGVINPTIIRQIDPKYTTEAMRAKIQGIVEMEAVVGVNGLITEIRVVKSLDRAFGLDQQAMATAKQWLFRPGTFQGKPVPVVVIIQMEFHLR